MNVLFIGDIVGSPGRSIVKSRLPELRHAWGLDFVVANVENSAGGNGVTPAVAEELFQAGIDGMTMGDHLWDKKEVAKLLLHESRFLRPLNFTEGTIGRGVTVLRRESRALAIINLIGRTFMSPYENPFERVWPALDAVHRETPCVLVDFHAEATSEKIAMGWMLDGQVSAVVGTHTHVQTADDRILPKGTAYISDVGFTGPHEGVLGREMEPVIDRFRTLAPRRFPVAKGDVRIQGVRLVVDEESGQARSIERVSLDENAEITL